MKRLLMIVAAGSLLTGCGSPQNTTSQQNVAPAMEQTNMTGTASIPGAQGKKTSADFVNEGMAFLQKSDPIAAVRSFDEAIKRDPKDFRLYLVLGQTYMRLHEYSRAADTLEAAMLVAPDQGELSYLLAVNYGLMGKKDLAKKNAEKSIELFRQKQDQENFLRAIALLKGMTDAEEAPAVDPVKTDAQKRIK